MSNTSDKSAVATVHGEELLQWFEETMDSIDKDHSLAAKNDVFVPPIATVSSNSVNVTISSSLQTQCLEQNMNSMNKNQTMSATNDVHISSIVGANNDSVNVAMALSSSSECFYKNMNSMDKNSSVVPINTGNERVPPIAAVCDNPINITVALSQTLDSTEINPNVGEQVQSGTTNSEQLEINVKDVPVATMRSELISTTKHYKNESTAHILDVASSNADCVGDAASPELITSNWTNTFVASMQDAVPAGTDKTLKETSSEMMNEEGDSISDSSNFSGDSSTSSSEYESSSDSSSDNELTINENPRMQADIKDRLKTKPILLEQDPAVKSIKVSLPEDIKFESIGKISSLIENKVVVVKALPLKPALDLDSILFLEDKTVLGQVYDTFGPVSSPYYVVCFNDEHKLDNLKVDLDVFFVPNVDTLTSLVFASQLQLLKGSDASWLNDREPPEALLDYSDDEQERNAKKKRQQAKRQGSCEAVEQEESDREPVVQKNLYSRKPRGRGRGTWTNRSIRYANPPSHVDEMQSSWVSACANLSSRRMTPNFPPSKMPPPSCNSTSMHCPPPSVGMPPPFNPMYNTPPPNWISMASRPPLPCQFPPNSFQSQLPFTPPPSHPFQLPPPPPSPPSPQTEMDASMNIINRFPPPPPPSQSSSTPPPDMSMLFSTPPN